MKPLFRPAALLLALLLLLPLVLHLLPLLLVKVRTSSLRWKVSSTS